MQILLVHFDKGGDLWPNKKGHKFSGSFLSGLAFNVSERWNQAKGEKGGRLIKAVRSKQQALRVRMSLRVEILFHDIQEQHHQ